MTTEIAIINRLGVALATDSAVTISGGGRTKVWDTADKLFEISSIHPVGIMINGNMDFLGIPWEILVREFRAAEGASDKHSVEEWMNDFLKYVQRHENVISGVDAFIKRVSEQIIKRIQHNVSKRITSIVNSQQSTKKGKNSKIVISEILMEEIRDQLSSLEKIEIADSLKDFDVSKIVNHYDTMFEEIVRRLFPPMPSHTLSDQEVVSIKALLVGKLLSSEASSYSTGLVFAGYGSGIFPEVHAVEVDGMVLDKLKFTCFERETVEDADGRGRVVSFAQTDVIERLLGGVDPRFIKKTAEFIQSAVAQIGRTVEQTMRSDTLTAAQTKKREKLITDISELVAHEYQTDVAVELRRKFELEFDKMIALMPKQELIELAEALVSITAVERKASSDEGTVGGPIDVAFITKHEGFVWIKRKHYFDKDLNPRYVWRMSRQLGLGARI